MRSFLYSPSYLAEIIYDLDLAERTANHLLVQIWENEKCFLFAEHQRDKKKFINIISNFSKNNVSQYAIKTNKTFLKMKKYLLNSFDHELSNGIVEGINNLIKQIKHNACGYRKFKHLKFRLMLIKGLYNPIKA